MATAKCSLPSFGPPSRDSGDRYAYVQDSPTVATDPAGLCDVVFGGITATPGTAASWDMTQFANAIGAETVFGYANGSLLGGFVDVVSQGLFGPNNSTQSGVAALTAAASDPGRINVFAISGGAQEYNTALEVLPSSITSRINNVTYISPGSVSDLAPGNGSTMVISNTFGAVDNIILWGSVGNATMLDTDCGHNSNCLFNSTFPTLLARAGTHCSTQLTFSRGGGGGDAGGVASGTGGLTTGGNSSVPGSGVVTGNGGYWACVTAAGHTECHWYSYR